MPAIQVVLCRADTVKHQQPFSIADSTDHGPKRCNARSGSNEYRREFARLVAKVAVWTADAERRTRGQRCQQGGKRSLREKPHAEHQVVVGRGRGNGVIPLRTAAVHPKPLAGDKCKTGRPLKMQFDGGSAEPAGSQHPCSDLRKRHTRSVSSRIPARFGHTQGMIAKPRQDEKVVGKAIEVHQNLGR